MQNRVRRLSLLAVALCLGSLVAKSQDVRDRTASLADITARTEFLKATKDPVLLEAIAKLPSCVSTSVVPVQPGPIKIPHHYLTGSNGPTNPEEARATVEYGRFEQRVAGGTMRWMATGDEKEAACVLDQLTLWANANALTDYDARAWSQSWFQCEWTLASTGTAMTVLVNDRNLNAEAMKKVIAWLDAAARKLVSWERPGSDDNNHHYWRSLAATSIGVVAGDNALFHFGIAAYRGAVGEIAADGSFPKEMARHENAIHYQAFASAPLAVIAQLAKRQGVDLFAYSAHGRTFRDAIVFLGKAMDDPTLVKKYASEQQHLGFHAPDINPLLYAVKAYGTEGMPPQILKLTSVHGFNSRAGGDALLLVGP